MPKTNIADSNFIIDSGVTVRDVMEAITDNQRGSVVVVDDAMRLVGVVSDGDLRRALLRGATLASRITGIVNLRPATVEEGANVDEEAKKMFGEYYHFTILPVINKDNVVVDVKVRNPELRKEF